MRYGIAIDIISFLFLTRIYFFVFWPPSAPVAVKSMNGALVMNGGVVIWSLAYSIRLAGGTILCSRGWSGLGGETGLHSNWCPY